MKPLAIGICEVKCRYVRPRCRGLGLDRSHARQPPSLTLGDAVQERALRSTTSLRVPAGVVGSRMTAILDEALAKPDGPTAAISQPGAAISLL